MATSDKYETDVDTGQATKVEAVVNVHDPKQDTTRVVTRGHKTNPTKGTCKQKCLRLSSKTGHTNTPGSVKLPTCTHVDRPKIPHREIKCDNVDDVDRYNDVTSDTESDSYSAAFHEDANNTVDAILQPDFSKLALNNSEQNLLERGVVRISSAGRAHRKKPYVTSASSPISATDSEYIGGDAASSKSDLQYESNRPPRRVYAPHNGPSSLQTAGMLTDRVQSGSSGFDQSVFATPSLQDYIFDTFAFDSCMNSNGTDVDALLNRVQPEANVSSSYLGAGAGINGSEGANNDEKVLAGHSRPTKDDLISPKPSSIAQTSGYSSIGHDASHPGAEANESHVSDQGSNIPTVVPRHVDEITAAFPVKEKPKAKKTKSARMRSSSKKTLGKAALTKSTLHGAAETSEIVGSVERVESARLNNHDFQDCIVSDFRGADTDASLDSDAATKIRAHLLNDESVNVATVTPVQTVGKSLPQTARILPTMSPVTPIAQHLTTTSSNAPATHAILTPNLDISSVPGFNPTFQLGNMPIYSSTAVINPTAVANGQPTDSAVQTGVVIAPSSYLFQPTTTPVYQTYAIVALNPLENSYQPPYQMPGQLPYEPYQLPCQLPGVRVVSSHASGPPVLPNTQHLLVNHGCNSPLLVQQQPWSAISGPIPPIANAHVLATSQVVSSSQAPTSRPVAQNKCKEDDNSASGSQFKPILPKPRST